MPAKKRLGQNFLRRKEYLERMRDAVASVCGDRDVVEIGPGKGALTAFLLPLVKKLTAVEIDSDLYPLLRGSFGDDPRFELVPQDILTYALPDCRDAIVVGNVPYYISFEIVDWVFAQYPKVKTAFFLFQKEFARKLCAKAGDEEYAFVSAYRGMWYDAEYLFKVPANAFDPQPKVDSAFVMLTRKTRPFCAASHREQMRDALRRIFAMDRKKAVNALARAFPDAVPTAFEQLGFDLQKRPSALTSQELSSISTFF
jgi:16S rRNA (adenine1518-N6/adenine1519-N6)-dimethyltransferase